MMSQTEESFLRRVSVSIAIEMEVEEHRVRRTLDVLPSLLMSRMPTGDHDVFSARVVAHEYIGGRGTGRAAEPCARAVGDRAAEPSGTERQAEETKP